MKHQDKKGRKFGRVKKVRRALLKALSVALIDCGRIRTTEAKAKELTRVIAPLITKAKKRGYVERTEIAGVDGRPLIWREERTYQVKENGLLNGLQTK